MQIVFKTNTVARVGGVQQHFAAGVHDVTPDDEAEKLVAAGDAEYADEGGGQSPRPTDAQLAAAEAAEAQRLADEAKAQQEAEAEAEAKAAAEAAEAQRVADEAKAKEAAEAEAEAKAAAEAQGEAAKAAANTKKAGGKKVSAFKAAVAADVQAVFINVKEFGDTHTIDGRAVPCVVDGDLLQERPGSQSEGVFVEEFVVFVATSDMTAPPVTTEKS